MFALLFLHFGNIATSAAFSGVNLDCTNNYEHLMSCHFDAPNCTDYNVTLLSLDGEKYCLPVQCASGKCCCSINMFLILHENHMASVRRGDKYVESKNISIKYSLKPNAPTIVSVKESNGNLRVAWMPNIEKAHLREQTRTNVTYHKKGDTKEVSEMSVITADGLSYLEILGDRLEPSTTYVFTAQNFLMWGSPPSNRSDVYEFTTSPAREGLLVAVIVSLSLVAVIATSGMYGCYVKCRAKYWDSVVDYQKSKLLDLNPSEQQVLKSTPPIISSIYVEPPTLDDIKSWSKGSLDSSIESLLQSSGIGNSPTSLSYTHTEAADIIESVQEALSKALVNINPMSQSTNHPLTSSLPSTRLSPCCGEQCSGTYRCQNKTTYSFIRPSFPTQIKTEQSQPGMLCHSDYQEVGGTSTCPDRQASACEDIVLPTVVSSYILTDTSHQQGSRDSGRFSNSDASLSCSKTSLNGDVESRTQEGQESCKEKFVGADDGSLPVSCNYQTFQGISRYSDIAFADWKNSEKDENLRKFLEKPLEDASKVDQAHSFLLARSQDSLPLDADYRAFQDPVKQPVIEITDQKCVEKKEELKKILDKRLENASKGDEAHRFMLARSQDSLPVDGDYRAFQSLVKQPGIKTADQKSVDKKEDLKKILDKRLENASKGDEGHCFMVARSQDSLPMDTHYQIFQGNRRHYQQSEQVLPAVVSSDMLTDTSYQQGRQDSGRFSNYDASFSCSKTSLIGDVESRIGEGQWRCKEVFVGADNGSLPVSCNYQAFQVLRRHSDITFADPKSKKVEDWEKSSENQSEDASQGDKGHSFMLARSQDSPPVDVHYQAFRGLGKHSGTVAPVSPDQSYRCLPEPQGPFLVFADQPHEIITESGYKIV
ncbi:uncharacterized protein LOC129178546 isoform X2 [Dunckerocampus dactyliophorus]|uniref:uncharacterized protein LOC129178546 isoform X2 n=1 Tax=Dunckerocampus dactyliophorus TaxID=161453 RepID=UPI0024075309|nr:uncharacterized protein LOC129178546 isoform X2 [Dunckerocampus dactyliophorus]